MGARGHSHPQRCSPRGGCSPRASLTQVTVTDLAVREETVQLRWSGSASRGPRRIWQQVQAPDHPLGTVSWAGLAVGLQGPPQGWGPGEQLWGVGRAPSQGPELCGPRPVAGGPFPHLSVPFQLPALSLADFRWFRSGHAPISQRRLCEPAGRVGGGFSPSHLPWSQWPRGAPWGVPGCSPPCRARCGHLDPSRCPDSRSLTPRSASPARGRPGGSEDRRLTEGRPWHRAQAGRGGGRMSRRICVALGGPRGGRGAGPAGVMLSREGAAPGQRVPNAVETGVSLPLTVGGERRGAAGGSVWQGNSTELAGAGRLS